MDTDKSDNNIYESNTFAEEGDIIGGLILLKNLLRENDYERVFLGFHEEHKINVYVKEVKHELYKIENVRCRLNLLKALDQKNIPKIYDFVQENDTCYIISEYVNGINLRDLIKIRRKSNKEIIKIMLQLCDILNYLSSKKILHGYFKADNLIVDNANNVFLIDYAFPEQYIKVLKENNLKFDHSIEDDIKNLGEMLYYLISGQEIEINKINSFNNLFDDNCEDEFKEIIDKALGNDNEGYLSINDFKDDLLSYNEKIQDIEGNSTVAIKYNEDSADDENYKKTLPKTDNKVFIKRIVAALVVFIAIALIFIIINKSSYKNTQNYPIISSLKNNPNNNADNDFYLHNSKDDTSESNNDNDSDNRSVTGNNYNGNNKGDTLNKGNTDTHGKGKAELINPYSVSGSLLNGTVNITVTDYTISDDVIMVNIHVQNDYKSKIELANDKLHIMNENRQMFLVDDDLMKKNQPDSKEVPSMENKDFTFYFSGYKESKELTFCIEDILTSNQDEDRNRSLELKFK